jgi:hypothetical protein
MTGFEMHRGKLQGFVAAWLAALLVAGCSGAVDEPEVADIEALDAATEEDTEPPADTEVPDDTEVAGEDVGADDPTETTEPADDATETADGDPYAIPEDGIDEAYVERVLNAIFEVNREALALTLDSEPGGLAPFEAEERLRAIYGGEYGARQLVSLNEIASSAEQRAIFRETTGAVAVRVLEVLDDGPSCLKVQRTSDFGAVLLEPGEPRHDYVALAPRPHEDMFRRHNPTPWILMDANIDAPERLECS